MACETEEKEEILKIRCMFSIRYLWSFVGRLPSVRNFMTIWEKMPCFYLRVCYPHPLRNALRDIPQSNNKQLPVCIRKPCVIVET